MNDIELDSLHPSINRAENRFEASIGEDLAIVEYTIDGRTIVITHTQVPPALEGQGIAGKLAKYALDWAKDNGYRVDPQCPYVRRYIERHPEYQANTVG